MNLAPLLKPLRSATLFLALSLACAACASSSVRPTEGAPPAAESMGPPEPYGPPAPATGDGPAATYGPEPIQYRAIVLVLGPGAARGFAYAGAIRALADAKIPVAAILGSEMGALIGAMYAVDGKVNHFEWGLVKLREDVLAPPASILPKLFQSSAKRPKLGKELAKIFGNLDLSQTKIPMKVSVPPESKVLDRGPIVSLLQETMELPPASLARAASALMSEARAMNLGPVVEISLSAAEGGADLVVRPDLSGVAEADFSKKTEAAFRGRQAVEKALPEIRHLVGLPEVPSA